MAEQTSTQSQSNPSQKPVSKDAAMDSDSKNSSRSAGSQDQSSKSTMDGGRKAGGDTASQDYEEETAVKPEGLQAKQGAQQSNRPTETSSNSKK